MGTYTGTNTCDGINPKKLTEGVTADPQGTKPSDAADIINGLGGSDNLDGGGGADRINGGDGYDRIFGSGSGSIFHGDGGCDSVGLEVGVGDGVQGWLYGDAGKDQMYLLVSGPENEAPPAITGSVLLYGGDGNDNISGYIAYGPVLRQFDVADSTLYLYGEAGNDTLTASWQQTSYDDNYYAMNSVDMLYGGPGNDSYMVFEANDHAVEKAGEGYDTVNAYEMDYTLPANVEKLVMSHVDSTLDTAGHTGTGNDAANVIVGSDLWERLSGAGGDDTIYGGLEVGDGVPASWYDSDFIFGGDGNDRIFGQYGNDRIFGGAGNDALAGQAGEDQLTGGAGNDRFVYEAIGDSEPNAIHHDTIMDMAGIGKTGGDRIDLAKIDANLTQAGDQAFALVGTAAALKAGQVHVVAGTGTDSLIQGEVDGKPGIDFEILVQDGGIKPSDWIAGDFIL